MANKENWKIPHLEIKKGEWYVCTNDWSDDGWLKFGKGDVVQAVEDNVLKDCYDIAHDFSVDGICYFRPADKDEIPQYARLQDITLTDFEKALDEYNIEGENFICGHDEVECHHEVRRIANELLPLARKQLEHDIRREIMQTMPQWKRMPNGAAGGERERYLIRSSKGYYFTAACIGGPGYYLDMEELEKLPGITGEE